MFRNRSFLLVGTLICSAWLFASQSSYACFIRAPQPVQVWLDHIYIEIVDQVAVKTYDCTFKNLNRNAVINGTCYMELEPGAQVDDMTVLVNGKEMKAEILDVDKAKEVFKNIIKEGGSPALLEYYGKQLIQTQIPKIPANGTVNVRLRYTTVLKKQGNLVRLQMLNTNPKTLKQTLQSASVKVNIRSTDPIKNVYSPTHKIKIEESDDWDVSVSWKQENYTPKHSFVLYYQTSNDFISAGVLPHKKSDKTGHFMMLLSPTVGKVDKNADIQPKDVVFCVDTSGSMLEGGKINQAKESLKYCIENLRDGDRFNIIDFSTASRQFHDAGLIEASDKSKSSAIEYIKSLTAKGGTAIEAALVDSMKQFPQSDRLKMIVFATDGLPTVGNRDPDKILKAVTEANERNVRLHVFGEGFDVNTKLLDFLAHENRGEADYILPDEKITERISAFFDRIGSPIMTDVKVSVQGVNVSDMFPNNIDDIHHGEQIVLYGKYSGSGNALVRLTGMVNGKKKTIDFEVNFPHATSDENGYVPRLWAGRKVDFLMREIRRDPNASDELVKEVTALAMQYGIVTPYTSFLMGEDILGGKREQLAQNANRRLRGIATQPQTGASAVERSKSLAKDRKASAESGAAGFADEAVADAFKPRANKQIGNEPTGLDLSGEKSDGASSNGSRVSDLKYIGSRTFYQQGKVWYQEGYSTKDTKIKETLTVGTDEYFEFLLKNTDLAKFLALENVVLMVGDDWYRFETKPKS